MNTLLLIERGKAAKRLNTAGCFFFAGILGLDFILLLKIFLIVFFKTSSALGTCQQRGLNLSPVS
jgi:hypothetical protein